jgi:hypothetical protein
MAVTRQGATNRYIALATPSLKPNPWSRGWAMYGFITKQHLYFFFPH